MVAELTADISELRYIPMVRRLELWKTKRKRNIMYHYLVEKDGKIVSFGYCRSRKGYIKMKELLEICGATTAKVSKYEWKKIRRHILMKDAKYELRCKYGQNM